MLQNPFFNIVQDTREGGDELGLDGEEVDDGIVDPIEKLFLNRGETVHKSGKKKVVSTTLLIKNLLNKVNIDRQIFPDFWSHEMVQYSFFYVYLRTLVRN